MASKFRTSILSGVAPLALVLGVLAPGGALAQEASTSQEEEAEREQLPTVVVDGVSSSRPAYSFGNPVDSGTSTFDRQAIEDRAPGNGDAIDLLRRLPHTQFSLERNTRVNEESLRDLRPEMISISGARPTDNLFTLDGVGTNSLFEMTSPGSRGTSPAHFNDVAAVSAQSIWVDTDLIGSIAVRDSNISAEYGRFTGGVIEIVTRNPSRRYGVQGSVSYTGSDLTEYRVPDSFVDELPEEPDYSRRRWSLSTDLPLTEQVSVLLAYSESQAQSTYYRGANYGGGEYGSESLSRNFLVKGLVELPYDMRLTAQVTHAPYRSEYAGGNGINNLILTHGGGTTGRLSLEGSRGVADWSLELNHAFSDMSREAPQYNFSRPSGGSINYCSATSCTEGGFGDINQTQADTSLVGRWSQPFFGGDLRMGFTYDRVEAQKERPDENRAYTTGPSQGGGRFPNVVCASPGDLACVTGEYALAQYVVYMPYDFNVSIDAVSLWGEHQREWNGVTFRAGLRYDYESFLGNHNIAPRLSVSGELPWFGITATGGLNRYYGRSFLSYAVREMAPQTLTYQRSPTVTGGQRIFYDEWRLSNVGVPANYSNADLDTPYNDEATLAFTGPTPFIGGEWRVRGVYRQGRDLITSNMGETVTYDAMGRPRTVTVYSPTNDGESEYLGGSFEYLRTIGNHSFTFSTSFTDASTNAPTEYDVSEDEELATTFVVFGGEVVSLLQLARENEQLDFQAPFSASLDWNSRWLDDRLMVGAAVRYRGSFERIEDTGVNQRIDNVNYDVFDVIDYDPSVDVDLNASFDLIRSGSREATVDVRVSNLFNSVPYQNIGYTTNPYQMGRTIWVGLNFRY